MLPHSWIATCPHETVNVLAQELSDLGITKQKMLHRGVAFETDLETAYRAHLSLRTASRLQRIVAMFEVSDLPAFQEYLKTISWAQWLRSHRPFTVQVALTDDPAQNLGEENLITAIASSIKKSSFEKSPPHFNPDSENSITIVVFIRNGHCVLGIDTAGRALHKRGWRTNGHPAVLKETLAASILKLTGYTGSETLLDPMCGSGTLVIEAAYIALNKAPLIHRGKDDFALEHLAGFDRALWRRVSDQLRAAKKNDLAFPIYASDICADYIKVARSSALKARVEKYIEFSSNPFQNWIPPATTGLLVANLPYGERLGSGMIQSLYKEMGETLEQRFSNWRIALLVPEKSPIHLLKLKFSAMISLRNGALPVKLLLTKENTLSEMSAKGI